MPKQEAAIIEQGEGAVRRGQLHEAATRRLRQMILAGELAPGERLREIQLCTQLGVSRTPIREAVRTLAAEGLVKLLPNRSAIVATLDDGDVAHVFEVIGTLEGLAGALACRNITDAQLAEIAGMHREMVRLHQRGDRANYLELNHAIHRAIVDVAGNPPLRAVLDTLLPRAAQARAAANRDPERWTAAVYEHAQIFATLAARDGEALSRLMREHFLNGLVSIRKSARVAPSEEAEEIAYNPG